MTTPRDLMTITLDVPSDRQVERGDLALALAGAELIDLLAAGAVSLDGDRIAPGDRPAPADALLEAAAAAVVAAPPYEPVADWLWRRGDGLAAAYRTAFESEGLLARRRSRGLGLRGGRTELSDTPGRRRAAERLATGEPVLAAFAAALGVGAQEGTDAPEVTDDTVAAVLAAVHDALLELEGVRRRRAVEDAAFDNIWRAQ
ncbi:GPP34 family phosphoprotein [Streptomyces sp. NPDC090022]|uniref:GPP34 family phosphoprotein n=1 Tax=Streptomyces sp. NPDC090022 TaxID=3365920 RepID=UPI0037FA0A87